MLFKIRCRMKQKGKRSKHTVLRQKERKKNDKITKRQRDRETEGQRDRKAERQKDRKTS
jgi:hypothetical protein